MRPELAAQQSTYNFPKLQNSLLKSPLTLFSPMNNLVLLFLPLLRLKRTYILI